MPRARSIHIGVNRPQKRPPGRSLRCSESTAWGMSAVAERAGYDSMLVLRGAEATRQAVNDALGDAAETLVDGDNLLVSFSGHGNQVRNASFGLTADRNERGFDEVWCLHDDHLADDELADCWRRFKEGVRILVVSESCFSGGVARIGECPTPCGSAAGGAQPALRAQRTVYRGAAGAGGGPRPRIDPPKETHGIQASLLLLAACREDQHAFDGVFTRHFFAVWNNGAFRGSYSDLFWKVHDLVVAEGLPQHPRIQLHGIDRGLLQAPAFRLAEPATRSARDIAEAVSRGSAWRGSRGGATPDRG